MSRETMYDTILVHYRTEIETVLAQALQHFAQEPNQTVPDAMRYSLLGGGKRIRGVMILALYRLFDEDFHKALPFAAAMEMIHTYSLIHDDLPCMDDDAVRRGKPACHIAFGESTALLAGDALLTLAFETACACDTLPADRVLRAVQKLASAAGVGGMVGGQQMDLESAHSQLPVQMLDQMYGRKTGALFSACAQIPCLLAGATPAQQAAALRYGADIGLAFQLMDDVLDVVSDQSLLGKPVGSDVQNNKNTYAALYGIASCRRRIADLSASAKGAVSTVGGDAWFLIRLADMLESREF